MHTPGDTSAQVSSTVRHGSIVGARWLRWLVPLTGLVALVWFLVRVIPKPSRASYPCQRAAFPLASAFIVWVTGTLTALIALGKARFSFRRSRRVVGVLCLLVAVAAGFMAVLNLPSLLVHAYKTPDPVNSPIGVAKGLYPGRVVWVYDPRACSWDGTTGLWDDPNHVNQAVVDSEVSRCIRALTNKPTDAQAWDALFKNFNATHARDPNYGYRAGEKIFIKLNLTMCNVDNGTGYTAYNGDQTDWSRQFVGPAPKMVLSLLRQLVNVVGVDPRNISIGDTTGRMYNQLFNVIHDYHQYGAGTDPNMAPQCIDPTWQQASGLPPLLPGRTAVHFSSESGYGPAVQFHWSQGDAGKIQDYLPSCLTQATYFINFAVFKSHKPAITDCGKNLYGILIRRPGQTGFFDMHPSLAMDTGFGGTPGMHKYRAITDLMCHSGVGGKTVLYMLDGLFGGYDYGDVSPPKKFRMSPFGNGWSRMPASTPGITSRWPASVFMSQDGVAIDSVAYDFWYAEGDISWNFFPFNSTSYPHYPQVDGGDDYLHELARDPNSWGVAHGGYDPENDGGLTTAFGVHEHWDSYTTKRYTRNLGTGSGIELVGITPPSSPTIVGAYVFYNNSPWDSNSTAPDPNDDNAIVTDKVALRPGQTAGFVNYTSYSKGLNGIMVDIAGMPVTSLTKADFTFKMGNNNTPSGWAAAPDPTYVNVRLGAGVSGSDRVTIIWDDYAQVPPATAIGKTWLQVTVKANSNTGLSTPYVFYFGNAVGETGNSAGDTFVNATDFGRVRDNPRGSLNPAAIDTPQDMNRDKRVDATDMGIVRDNATGSLNSLKLIAVP